MPDEKSSREILSLSDIDGGKIQVGEITVDLKAGGDIAGRDKIVKSANNVIQQAIGAAQKAEEAQAYTLKRLAEGVKGYAQQLAAAATGEAEGPYKGLLAYGLGDAGLFYGREQASAELLRLANRYPLTILHAGPGVGKSSLLQAGLSPRLLAKAQLHLPVYVRPYNVSPTLAIKRAFLPDLQDIPDLAQAPLPEFLHQTLDLLGPKARLYLLLDQFEETFTLLPEVERAAFITDLAGCLGDESLNVHWVLALRSEFFSHIAAFRPQIENPFKNDYHLDRLNRAEAAGAIVAPAARYGLAVEPALVEALLQDLPDEKGLRPEAQPEGGVYPPHLQLVCLTLYDRLVDQQKANPAGLKQIGRLLYEQEGRAKGILQGYLKRVLSQNLSTRQEQDLARYVLAALVSCGQDRIRCSRSDLAHRLEPYLGAVGQGEDKVKQIEPLLGQLVKSRLVIVEQDEETGEPSYELAHDYLLAEIELDPELQARQAAQEMLDQEVEAYKQFKTLLDKDRFGLIHSQRLFLTLDETAEELLRRSREAIEAEEREGETQGRPNLEQEVLAGKYRKRALWWVGTGIGVILLATVIVLLVVQSNQKAKLATAGEATAQENAALAATREADAKATAALAFANQATAAAEKDQAEVERDQARTEAGQAKQAEATAEAERQKAERLARLSRARELAVWAQTVRDESGQLNLMLAREAVLATWLVDSPVVSRPIVTAEADAALRAAVNQAGAGRLLTLPRPGQTAPVWSVVFSPDGQRIASSGREQIVRLWDTQTGQEVGRLSGHTGPIWSVIFSPDGRRIASGSSDRTVRLWDAQTGQELGQLSGHQGEVLATAFSPDGSQIASGSADGTVRLWDAQSGTELRQLTGHTGWVMTTAFSPDGSQIASGGADGTVRLWDVQSGTELRQLAGHTGWVRSIAFSPEGSQIVSGGQDQTVRQWNVQSGVELRQLNGGQGLVSSVAVSPDGRLIISGGVDGIVRLWDAQTGEELRQLNGHTGSVWSAAFSLDGRQIASGGEDQTIHLWDVQTGEELRQLSQVVGWIWSVAFSPDGRWIASGSGDPLNNNGDNNIRVWDLQTGQALLRLSGHTSWVRSVAFSPDGSQIASGSADKTVRLWDVQTGEELRQLSGHEAEVLGVAFSPDGKQIASGSADKTVRLWDAQTGQELRQLSGHEAEVLGVAFSPDGKQIASGSADGTVRLWDTQTGKELGQLSGHQGGVLAAAFSPDGKRVASGSADGTVRLWGAQTGQELGQLSGHRGEVLSVTFSPDGRQIASGSADGTVRLWDAQTGLELRRLSGHTNWVSSVAFSPDGKLVASGSYDQTIRLWPDIEGLLLLSARLIRRDPPVFSPEELRRFGFEN